MRGGRWSVLPQRFRPAGRARTRRVSAQFTGNETLTRSTAALLTVLLVAEGATVLDVGGMLNVHMFIGLVLIPPVLLKLASAELPMVARLHGGSGLPREGPPALPLRMLAPGARRRDVGIFTSGVALLALGHRSDVLLTLHKASFIVWGVVFAAHLPGVRAAGAAVLPRRLGRGAAGAGAGRVAAEALLARRWAAEWRSRLTLLPPITDWVRASGAG